MQRTERQMVSSSHNPFIAVVACTDHPSLPPSSTSSLIMKHRCCSSVRLSDLLCSQNPSAKVCSCVGDYIISMDSLNLISLGFLDLPFLLSFSFEICYLGSMYFCTDTCHVRWLVGRESFNHFRRSRDHRASQISTRVFIPSSWLL